MTHHARPTIGAPFWKSLIVAVGVVTLGVLVVRRADELHVFDVRVGDDVVHDIGIYIRVMDHHIHDQLRSREQIQRCYFPDNEMGSDFLVLKSSSVRSDVMMSNWDRSMDG